MGYRRTPQGRGPGEPRSAPTGGGARCSRGGGSLASTGSRGGSRAAWRLPPGRAGTGLAPSAGRAPRPAGRRLCLLLCLLLRRHPGCRPRLPAARSPPDASPSLGEAPFPHGADHVRRAAAAAAAAGRAARAAAATRCQHRRGRGDGAALRCRPGRGRREDGGESVRPGGVPTLPRRQVGHSGRVGPRETMEERPQGRTWQGQAALGPAALPPKLSPAVSAARRGADVWGVPSFLPPPRRGGGRARLAAGTRGRRHFG